MEPREYIRITWRNPRQPFRIRFAFELFRNTGGTITCYAQVGTRTWWIKKGY